MIMLFTYIYVDHKRKILSKKKKKNQENMCENAFVCKELIKLPLYNCMGFVNNS